MYDYVYIIYAFVKHLDDPPVIICLSCRPGEIERAVKETWSVSMILSPGTQLLHAPPSRCTDIPCKGSINIMNDCCWKLCHVLVF